mgnify:FL=1
MSSIPGNAAFSGAPSPPPRALLLIAGGGAYPVELIRSARAQGVERIVALGFRGETSRMAAALADEVRWLALGRLREALDAAESVGIPDVVMAGRIRPHNLFRLRPDREAFEILAALRVKNAETIFGAIGERLAQRGLTLRPASWFMEKAMPAPGLLSRRAPTAREESDIALGRRVAKTTSGLDIGQTVVVKDGVILAIEAFEGTDAALRRAGRLGGAGTVAVKCAKRGHDMRFDIPVIGAGTLRTLRRIRAAALAIEAGRTIVLERDAVIRAADRAGLCLVAFEGEP